MQHIRLRLAYDGTDYGGFQIQKNTFTIQEKLEKALLEVYKEEIRVTGAGRTDSGVHARGQVVNYTAQATLPVDRICWALNSVLPRDIVVWEAVKVNESFHSSFDAVSKIYSYTIDTARFIQVLKRRYSWHCSEPLDTILMRRGANILKGRHDFKVFQGSKSEVKTTVRTLYNITVNPVDEEEIIYINVEGDGFLYKMVRFICGALVELGKGDLDEYTLEDALQKGSEERIAPALPAKGLCLEKVNY